MADSEHLVSAVRRYYECVDANDVPGILALFTPEATYRRPGYPPIVGTTAWEDFYRNQRVIESGRHTLVNVVRDGNQVAVQGTFAGVLRNGSVAELEFADFYRSDGDLFTERTTYFYAPLV